MIKSKLTSENNKWNEAPDECKVELRTKSTDVMITPLLENRKGDDNCGGKADGLHTHGGPSYIVTVTRGRVGEGGSGAEIPKPR